jgi:hypothetical protein
MPPVGVSFIPYTSELQFQHRNLAMHVRAPRDTDRPDLKKMLAIRVQNSSSLSLFLSEFGTKSLCCACKDFKIMRGCIHSRAALGA